MSTPFEIPEWLIEQSDPPPLPPVDDHRVEGLVNGFIAGKQDALFTAPDAYYRSQGRDALDGAPAIAQRLQDLRSATLDQVRDDGERAALAPRLDAHLDDAMDGIGRHVAAQRLVFQRNTLGTRQALIRRAAELEHDNDDKIAGLAEAHAGAAQELARLDGVDPESAQGAAIGAAARSQILRTAIDQRIVNARPQQAIDFYDKVKAGLTPDDRRALELPIGAATDDAATDAWLAREAGKDGPPLDARAGLDDGLSDLQRLILRAKIGARDSAAESSRVATVKGLDDQLTDATKAIATQPSQYRTGTLNALAKAYEDAGAPDKAADTRRLAAAEPLLLPFAKTNVAIQQRRLDDFTGPERAMAEAIMNHQADAFASDPYAAGTSLYPDVGMALPAENTEGRLRQARMIETMRGGAAAAAQPDAPLTPVKLSPDDEPQPHTAPDSNANPADAHDVQIAQATPDDAQPSNAPARGVAPPTEPPSNDQDLEKTFQRQTGVEVKLPDGSYIEDPHSPTGHIMAPFNDLKEVAAAARRAKEKIEDNPGPPNNGEILARVREALKTNVGQGGTYDYQRRANKYGKDGFTQLPQFRNISNVNVGLSCQQFGLSLGNTLLIAGTYALTHSKNSSWSKPYFLDDDTKKYIEIGYKLGESGKLD